MEKNKVGLVVFLASEAAFFIFLIIAYLYYNLAPQASGPRAGQVLDPLTAGIYTLFLLASSLTVWLAGRAWQREQRRSALLWLAVTILCGVIFLAGQGREWARLLGGQVTPHSNTFGTTFFTLTGFHGLHVSLGLIALAVVLGLTWRNRLHLPGSSALETIAVYWHFVDAVWIVIFAVVYLTALAHL